MSRSKKQITRLDDEWLEEAARAVKEADEGLKPWEVILTFAASAVGFGALYAAIWWGWFR